MKTVIPYPRSVDDRLHEAVTMFRNKEYGRARPLFMELIDEGCDDAFVYMGAIHEKPNETGVRDWDSAWFYYNEAVTRRGTLSAYLGLIRAHLYADPPLRDYDQAKRYCELVISQDPNPHAYFFLGHIYLEGMGVNVDVDEAIRSFRESWRRGYVFARTFIGLAECGRGNRIRGWYHRFAAMVVTFKLLFDSKSAWRIVAPPHWTHTDYKKHYRY